MQLEEAIISKKLQDTSVNSRKSANNNFEKVIGSFSFLNEEERKVSKETHHLKLFNFNLNSIEFLPTILDETKSNLRS